MFCVNVAILTLGTLLLSHATLTSTTAERLTKPLGKDYSRDRKKSDYRGEPLNSPLLTFSGGSSETSKRM